MNKYVETVRYDMQLFASIYSAVKFPRRNF